MTAEVTGGVPRLAPLAGRAADLARLASETAGRVAAVEVAGLAQVAVRVEPSSAEGLPVRLPLEPNTVAVDGDVETLWLGPDEWLLVGPEASVATAAAALADALAGAHHGLVDVGANRAIVELTGRGRHRLLSHGCPIDLHPRAWRPGACAQTLLARAPVLLQEQARATRVFVRPSYGDHLVDRLLDAAGA
ncbi:MAG TPA: sarcosine oxidase subunit gamma family protein [Actinomycetota bacterium]